MSTSRTTPEDSFAAFKEQCKLLYPTQAEFARAVRQGEVIFRRLTKL